MWPHDVLCSFSFLPCCMAMLRDIRGNLGKAKFWLRDPGVRRWHCFWPKSRWSHLLCQPMQTMRRFGPRAQCVGNILSRDTEALSFQIGVFYVICLGSFVGQPWLAGIKFIEILQRPSPNQLNPINRQINSSTGHAAEWTAEIQPVPMYNVELRAAIFNLTLH
jgi:hypothetical protein